jgi:hypothetical protein
VDVSGRRVSAMAMAMAMASCSTTTTILDGADLATTARAAAELLSRQPTDDAVTWSFPFLESACGDAADPLNALALNPRLLRLAAAALGAKDQHGVRLVEAVLHGCPDDKPATHDSSHFGVPAQSGEALVAIVSLVEGAADAGRATLIGLQTPFQTRCPISLRVTLRADFAEWISADAYVRSAPVKLAQLPIQLSALGFPPPGHAHWTPASLAEAARRYPALDLHAYAAKLTCQGSGEVEAAVVAKSELPAREPQRDGGSLDGAGRYWVPVEQAAGTDPLRAPLSARQVEAFREQGCVLIDGLWPAELVAAASRAADICHPAHDQAADRPQRLTRVDAGGRLAKRGHHDAARTYPFDAPALNDLTLYPGILAAVAQLMQVEVPEIRLTQSALNGKRGLQAPLKPGEKLDFSWGQRDGNQPMHLDYNNNTLLTPARSTTRWAEPDEVQAIVYLDDWRTGGPTAFVPGLTHTSQGDDVSPMYSLERMPRYHAGTALIYQLGCWHRGTPVNHGHVRRKHHLSFRSAGAEWIGGAVSVGHPTAKTFAALERATNGLFSVAGYIGDLSVEQRTVIGFPPLGSRYWTDETTLDGMRAKYGERVVAPYADAATLLSSQARL